MKQVVSLILLLMIMSSCATVFLRKDYPISVRSEVPNTKAEILDSTYTLPAKLRVPRSKDDLTIKVIGDTISRNFVVRSFPNEAFLLGNLFWGPAFPVAFAVDFTNHKRFTYGRDVYLNLSDSNNIIRPLLTDLYYKSIKGREPAEKGDLNFSCSLPWVNSFYMQPIGETSKVNTGFIGASLGFEYYYKQNKFGSLTISGVMDFFLPFPAPVDFSGESESMSSVFLSLTDNYKFKRFTLGYGLNYSQNTWKFIYHDRFDPPPPTREPATRKDASIGMTIDGYYQFGKFMYLGLIYRPTFLSIMPEPELKYQHLISLDLKMRIQFQNF